MHHKVIVITGATSGVGLQVVETFLENNWIVIGLSKDLKKLNSLNNRLNDRYFHHIATDISNSQSVINAFQKISQITTHVDVLVNNASIFKQKPFIDFDIQEIDNIIDTNLKGTIYCTLQCLKLMSIGRIINIGSVSAIHGIENQSIYSASKYGINGFAETLNQELIKTGIKISTIHPGGIDTPLWNSKNPYSGDVKNLLKPKDIVDIIQYITKLPDNVVLKNITVFPTCEWH
jgi:uncharacterized protein